MNCVLVGPIYPYRGGIAHYTAKLAQAFSARGSQVHVFSFSRQYPHWLYPGKTDRDPSLRPMQTQAEYLLDPLYPWTWWHTARRIVGLVPDLVIFQWWSTFWAPAFFTMVTILHRRNIKVLFIIHNVMPHEARPWDRWLARLALSGADSFIVQSEREQARLLLLFPHATTTLIPLPVYDMFVSQRIPRPEAKQKLGMPAEAKVALFFGLVRPYKGLKYALRALAELKAQGHPFNLLVAGEFWEDIVEYQRLVDQLGLSPWVHLHNRYIPDEEVSLFFSAADVFLAPYIDGTQSAVVKIALSFDLPMVISQSIATAELLGDTNHRFYWVPPADVHRLADAIGLCFNENDIPIGGQPQPFSVDGWESLAERIEALG